MKRPGRAMKRAVRLKEVVKSLSYPGFTCSLPCVPPQKKEVAANKERTGMARAEKVVAI